MNLHPSITHATRRVVRLAPVFAACVALGLASSAMAAPPKKKPEETVANQPVQPRLAAPCTSIRMVDPATVTLGKSTLVKLPAPATRVLVGGLPSGYAGKLVDADAKGERGAQPAAASTAKTGVADMDVILLSPNELYLLGKSVGSMNVILQSASGECTIMDVAVVMDAATLQAKLRDLMPGEKNVKITAAEDSLILTGEVADAVKVDRVATLAGAYAPEKKVINMLRAAAPQQVMLEVKVAEVSKALLDRLGAEVRWTGTNGDWTYSLISQFLTGSGGILDAFKDPGKFVTIDGEKRDGIIRILAEPNLMAISGQTASFLSGGKIFIPVAQSSANGVGFPVITLQEEDFGVGVTFTPTVLEGGRINLKVTPEVSELSQTGTPFTTVGNATAVLPSMIVRRADTTVQLHDGQSFAIAGLIRNNITEAINKYPVLGEIPIFGALFRSSEFAKDLTELLFVITPRLVKPLAPNYALPTDSFVEPTRPEFFLEGKMEGRREGPPPRPAQAPAATEPATTGAAPRSAGGFETK
jgi:pilus assembly protein CpaC